MKKGELLKRIKAQGCVFIKHGKKHDIYKNPHTGPMPEYRMWFYSIYDSKYNPEEIGDTGIDAMITLLHCILSGRKIKSYG